MKCEKHGEPRDTAEARLARWITKPAQVGDNMTWVGKNYSLEQCKRDVRVLWAELQRRD